MRQFMDDDFLLETRTAERLYHGHAEHLPIIDYHCAVHPRDIVEDRRFYHLTEAWVAEDPYKWRLMRTHGTPEKFVTGSATTPREKFQRFAEALSGAIGNPLYHWSHLELQRYFGIDWTLNSQTVEDIWETANEKLADPNLSARGILRRFRVAVISTLEDAADPLIWTKQLQQTKDGLDTTVVPMMNMTNVLHIEDPDWGNYMQYDIGAAAGIEIMTMQDVRDALMKRIDFFHAAGCRTADHSLAYPVFAPAEEYELDDIVGKIVNGKDEATPEEAAKFQTALLAFLGHAYCKRNWVMQIHLGALYDNNSRFLAEIGRRAGFDCIGGYAHADGLVKLFNAMDLAESLPKLVLSSANPADRTMLATILDSFQGADMSGKLQLGGAWWFNQTKSGIEAQLTTLAEQQVLGDSIGMATEATTLFSYPRQEYFRRILCNFIGNLVERGEFPADFDDLGTIVENICYRNAAQYFGFALPEAYRN